MTTLGVQCSATEASYTLAQVILLRPEHVTYILGLHEGQYEFVFTSPEAVLQRTWKAMFLGQIWQDQVKLIVIDEAHCISEWSVTFKMCFDGLHV